MKIFKGLAAEALKNLYLLVFCAKIGSSGAGVASLFSPMRRASLGNKKRANARRFFKKSGNGARDWT